MSESQDIKLWIEGKNKHLWRKPVDTLLFVGRADVPEAPTVQAVSIVLLSSKVSLTSQGAAWTKRSSQEHGFIVSVCRREKLFG